MIIIVIHSVVDADPDSIYHPDGDPDADSDFLFDADPVLIRIFNLMRIYIGIQVLASEKKTQTLENMLK